jgi:AraC family transcriptional regulator of adaptative response/methylated-DNA-[protein]-cysteine methyltransferase
VETQIMSDAERWRAVVTRDRRLDGAFVYGVRSTGIYCRVGCPARRPRRNQVEFFSIPAAAERAGYRACRRCRPRDAIRRHPQVQLVERACRILDDAAERLTLADLGRRLGVSPAHLQRVFRRVAGISPRAYAEVRRTRRLRAGLRRGASVSHAVYDAGYGSPSRVYEGRSRSIGMTPASYRAGGEGERIAFTTADSSLGRVLVAATRRGVCFVSLAEREEQVVAALDQEFPRAERYRDDALLGSVVTSVVERLSGKPGHDELPLDIRATAFQQRVWDALRRIPSGETITYAELARRIGRPTAVRAVAGACARNNVAVVIPCHRAVRSDGGLGGYRWGIERKRRLLALEREEHLRVPAVPAAPG